MNKKAEAFNLGLKILIGFQPFPCSMKRLF
nr:MAG TPA: hypothetical protein [Caudoviricetes sp.]